jgi:2-keto-3-deoxy-L-fuconate dehydrogenase
MRLAGKTALVTAAAQGIGRATAEAFKREGATVIAADIRTEPLADAEGPAGAPAGRHRRCGDQGDRRGVPQVDVLYNCAGFVHAGTILDCDEDDWAFSNSLNVTAQYRMIRAFLPGMIRNGGGSIINMSSIASSIKGVPNRFAYGATKAAVIGLTKSVAADFVAKGVRCNAICPGTVETPSLLQRLRDTGDFDKAYAEFTARQAMGRFGRVEELAALAVYLASDESAFTTGRTSSTAAGSTSRSKRKAHETAPLRPGRPGKARCSGRPGPGARPQRRGGRHRRRDPVRRGAGPAARSGPRTPCPSRPPTSVTAPAWARSASSCASA